MKKWCRRAGYILLAACILLVGFDLSLRRVSSSAWMRKWVTETLSVSLGREVRLEKLSASLLGIKINGFALSEAGGFKEGTFVGVDRLRLRVSWWHLLHKHVKVRSIAVNGVYVQLIKDADGRFNFDSLSSSDSQVASSSSGLPVRITADRVDLRNVNFAYLQEPELSFIVHNASFSAHGVGLDRLFEARLNATAEYRAGETSILFPVGVSALVHLAEMNLENAYAQLSTFSVRSGETVLNVQGSAHDFTRPQVELTAEVRRLSSAALAPFAPDLPSFSVPQMRLSAAAFLDLPAHKAEVSSFGFSMPGMQAGGGGTVSYAKTPQYDARVMFNLDLRELSTLSPELAAPYNLLGTVSGSADISNARLSADATLAEVGAVVPYAGILKGLNASLKAEEAGDFKTGSAQAKFSAKLNDAPFLMDFRVTQSADKIAAVLNASAKRVALPPMPKAETQQPEPEFVTDTTLSAAPKTPWPLPPVSALVDIKIDSLDAPFFYGTDVAFKADLTGLTPGLKNAQGDLSLRTGNGEIRDLYRLTNASPVTKVLFLSLNVVGKVFNSLDVFSVLSGLAGDEDAAQDNAKAESSVVKVVTGPDGQPMQIMVPYSSRKMDGHMKYDQFDTAIHFKDGVADMKEGTFVSDTISFTLSGRTDFKTEKIDMSVQAAPGKHYADGIMPLKLNIGGTVAEPTGSMSVLGSVSSLVTQGVMNNFASNTVKKGVGGLFGLFKKEPATTAPAAPAQEP
ncbi:MAG: AsmA-like C-terminal region-containing protein [Elusimicrobia bacterium]|nr:AsmA-like C-terminal region-containing protein [Elusimicrobiota bacterium]